MKWTIFLSLFTVSFIQKGIVDKCQMDKCW
jgi:hypothetical protein